MSDTLEPSPQRTEKKRSLHRSPSYPVIPLAEAIEKVRDIYKHEKKSLTTADVIAAHLGYKYAKGNGGRAVSALRQYGLIEEVSGSLRVSDLGYTLIQFDPSTNEWQAAIQEAAGKPTVIRDLWNMYGLGGLPSDATLRTELLKRGFNPESIDDVIRIVRESLSMVQCDYPGYNGATEDASMVQAAHRTSNPLPQTVQAVTATTPQSAPPAGATISYRIDISRSRGIYGELRIVGDLQKEDITRLRKAVEAQITMIDLATDDTED